MSKTATLRRPARLRAGRALLETVAGERGNKLKVDREKRIIYGVKVLGRFSQNKHVEGTTGSEYSPQAMKQACQLYEGMTVRTDHADRKNPSAGRSVYETFGQLQNCRIDGDAVRADLYYLPDHPMTNNVLADVESGLGVFGLSHNARAGREIVRNGRLVIEELELVRSVDLVDKPATNRNLWESVTVAKTFREILEELVEAETDKARKACASALMEDDGAYMDAPVESAPSDPDEALKAGFRAAIDAVLNDDSLSVKDQLKKIGELLKTEEKLVGGGDSGGGAAADTTESQDAKGDEGDSADEKKNKEESMKERLDQLERKDACRDLCESLGFAPTKDQLADLMEIGSDTARKRVAEAYKAAGGKAAAPVRGGPRSRTPGTGRTVTESQRAAPSGRPMPTTTKGFLNKVR